MAMIPGDPATAILGSYATPENVEKLNRDLGLDQAVGAAIFHLARQHAAGRFRAQFRAEPAGAGRGARPFRRDVDPCGHCLCPVFDLGIAAGVISAARQYGFADKAITFAVLLGISIPSFFLGMMMILIFAVKLRWFPVSGMWPIYGARDLPALMDHLTMPAIALAVVATGVIARLSRSAMLEVLRQDFIRTARAKGVHERRVIWRHALRAAMVSIIPILGIQAGFVLSGAVYIEMVFQWPGVGRMLVDAILKRDILLVQGGVVFVAACYVLFNITVDVAQSLLDPRIKT